MKKCIISTAIFVRNAELVVKSKKKCGKEYSEPVLWFWLSMNLEMVKYSQFEMGFLYGLINYKDINAKFRHLKGLCGRCLSEFIDWRYRQTCWYFGPSFVNYSIAPLTFFLVKLPPSPLPRFKVSICRQSVAGRGLGGGGVLSPVGDYILQEFNTLYPTSFRTHKIARPSQTKP